MTDKPMISIYRISGGWLLVSNVVSHGSSPTQLPVKTSYRGVNSKEMVLTKSAMKELRNHLHFSQIRFHCKKRGGRTFHITTAANSKGEAAVKYLSGETDLMPASCGSFVIMSNDNSRLARCLQGLGGTKEVLSKLANGAPREIRIDYTTTLLLQRQLTTGFLYRLAGGNATILSWQCHVAIFGKSLRDKKSP